MQSCPLIYRQQQNGGFFMSDEFNKSGCASSTLLSQLAVPEAVRIKLAAIPNSDTPNPSRHDTGR